MKRTMAIIAAAVLVPLVTQAHVTDREEADFSFENPFVIQGGPTASPLMPFIPNALAIMKSRAVFSYLEEGGYDVYRFTVSADDCRKFAGYDQNGVPQFTPSPVIVAASALPMAFVEYRNFYPSIALLGPGFPPVGEEVPFPVPAGLGGIVRHNPRVPTGTARPVFAFSEAGMAGVIEWFLPLGLTQECLLGAPWTCDYGNTISQPIFVPPGTPPQTYYLVIFNTTTRPGDVTANIGFLEYLDQAGTMPIPPTHAEALRHATTLPLALSCQLFHLPCHYVQ